jgi:hypothetical protein
MKTYPRPSTSRRVELYLQKAIELLSGRLRGLISAADPALRVATWSTSNDDLVALADYLVDLGALKSRPGGQQYLLTAKGHIIFEEMSGARAASVQAFVAMWFDPSMDEVYSAGFKKAITAAGYEPFRIDRKDYDGKIDDEIVAEIRRSAFLVADFTDHRGGVYYETGFAHGLGKRVIFTCRADELSKLHFDVRQYNTIVWSAVSDLLAPLQNRILALFGAGPLNRDAKPIPLR